MTRFSINTLVNTPNGPGRVVSTYYLSGDPPMDPPSGILIRHPKDHNIDISKCAALCSETGASGWLAVYRQEEIQP